MDRAQVLALLAESKPELATRYASYVPKGHNYPPGAGWAMGGVAALVDRPGMKPRLDGLRATKSTEVD